MLPYSEIRDWCAHCSIIPGIPECVANAFKQYANFIELWLNNETDDVDIIQLCKDHLDEAHAIYLSNNTDDATQCVKNNYDQIIKTYIASKFPGKTWNGNLLEVYPVGDSIFRITIQFADKKFLYGITQTKDVPKAFMPYDSGIKGLANENEYEYKDNAKEGQKHDCWWVYYKEAQIKESPISNQIKILFPKWKNLIDMMI